MKQVLKGAFKQALNNTYNTDFQNAVDELFLHIYGDDYSPIKQKHDKGCDGILQSEKAIVCVYGPEKYDLPKFKSKIQEDYKNYAINWSQGYPNWKVIYNDEIRGAQEEFIKTLKNDGGIIGIKNLLDYIDNLPRHKQRSFAKYMRIDDDYINTDIMSEILDDLVAESTTTIELKFRDITYIPEKIDLNFTKEDITSARDEYSTVNKYFTTLEKLISGYPDTEKDAFKTKIIQDFNSCVGSFKEKLIQTAKTYNQKYTDDLYNFFIRVILIYMFEQCLIGKKVNSDKYAKTSS